MNPFELHFGTRVVCESDAHRRVGSLVRVYGHRVLLVTGSSSAQASGALAAVESSLAQAGCEVAIIEGIPGNPSVAVVDAGCRYAESQGVQAVVGLGGGSVIDVAKAIAIGAALPMPAAGSRSVRRLLSGIAGLEDRVDEALPTIAIPTLAGSGSEVNGVSVLVDEATGRKLSLSSDLAAPRLALVDPELLAAAPVHLRGAGYADALCHAVEAGLSVRASVASDGFAEAAVRALTRAGVDLLDAGTDTAAAAWWATIEASYALGLAGSIVTHPLAHPLSARAGIHHANAVAALEPVVIRELAARWGDSAVRVASWFGSRSTKPLSAARALADRVQARVGELGATAGLPDIELGAAAADHCAQDALLSGSRGIANTPGDPVDRMQLAAMLSAAFDEAG